jgi:hypothetical protein
MSDVTALHDQALAAAAEVLSQMTGLIPDELHGIVRSGLAIAWIEGRHAGGEEAAAAVRRLLASYQ